MERIKAVIVFIGMGCAVAAWGYSSFAPVSIVDRIISIEQKIDDIHWYLIGGNKK
jgi:hypothetical protein